MPKAAAIDAELQHGVVGIHIDRLQADGGDTDTQEQHHEEPREVAALGTQPSQQGTRRRWWRRICRFPYEYAQHGEAAQVGQGDESHDLPRLGRQVLIEDEVEEACADSQADNAETAEKTAQHMVWHGVVDQGDEQRVAGQRKHFEQHPCHRHASDDCLRALVRIAAGQAQHEIGEWFGKGKQDQARRQQWRKSDQEWYASARGGTRAVAPRAYGRRP